MTSAADWQTRVGEAWAAEWRRTDRSFEGLDPHLLAAILAAAPERGRALDIGCGAGATSIALARERPELKITGVDLSPALAATARARAADRDIANVEVFAGDALDAGSDPRFDLLFSRHGVMFFADPAAAFARLAAIAAPGAPLVFSCFRNRAANGWAIETAAALGAPPDVRAGLLGGPGPFAFADREEVAALLAAAGWTAIQATPIDYAYRAGEGADPVADAVAFFGRIGPTATLLAEADPADLAELRRRLAAACAARLSDGVVDFPAAAWLWSARAPGRHEGSGT